ncbi:MAG: CheR family methyltransferase, partial [Oceanidesulfovibrio sp.]
MRTIQPSESLDRLAAMVLELWGLQFSKDRYKDLSRGVEAAAKSLGLPSETFVAMILREPAHSSRGKLLSILVEKLTVGESYFFRETRSIHALDESILPSLIHARSQQRDRRLRLWSAGCATGEEPYTLSILLDRVFKRLGERREDWDVEILATDINREFLRRARHGVYRQWSFRAAPPWLKERYFEETNDNRWRVKDKVRELIRFRLYNLCDRETRLAEGSGMDVILCRNVLIYFSYEKMACALKNLRSHLAAQGWLITSPTESAHVLESNIFVPCRVLDLLAFCKAEPESPQPPEVPPPAEPAIPYAVAGGADMAWYGGATAGEPAMSAGMADASVAVHAPEPTAPTVDEVGGALEAAEAAIVHGELERAEAYARSFLHKNGNA